MRRYAHPDVLLTGPATPADADVLTPDALAFVADLTRGFRERIADLLCHRQARQARFDAGERPGFLEGTAWIREGDWRCPALPADLADRRVEITGPVDRKMIIGGLNSGARVFMADFEDATAPAWPILVAGQKNLVDAVRGDIRYVHPQTSKVYELGDRPATLMVRPRGLHLPESHLLVQQRPAPAALVDFGLFFFHNARALVSKGTGPYFYLPKLESHQEARLWNDVFLHAQAALGLPAGTIKATVLIETLPAAFEMDEILHALGRHAAGLNCGRWDYIFSFIKKLRADPARVLPDRQQLTMDGGFMRPYVQLLIQTCHRRGVHAMGGMAAQIPIRGDDIANQKALAAVRADKVREVTAGHDGTWVAHPGLVPVATDVFDEHMPGPNQIDRARPDAPITAEDLLRAPGGTRTEEGLRHNIRVGLQYLAAWLGGLGCVPLYNLMEDAATAEISRAQIWQWLRHAARLEDGRPVTPELVRRLLVEELARVKGQAGGPAAGPQLEAARELLERLTLADRFEEFLTLPAYELLRARRGVAAV